MEVVLKVWDRVLVEEDERVVLGNCVSTRVLAFEPKIRSQHVGIDMSHLTLTCELEASRAAATESSLKLKLVDSLVTSVASTNCRVYVSVVDSAGGVQAYEVPVNAPSQAISLELHNPGFRHSYFQS